MSRQPPPEGTHGLARVLSKRGLASRAQAARLIEAGRVTVSGRVVTDPEARTALDAPDIAVDGRPAEAEAPVYLMLNKPRGLVTTASDPEGRDTVYRCLEGLDLPHVSPVGRLDKASEGLLLLTNDTLWAQGILDENGPAKTYHVKIDRPPNPELFAALTRGVEDKGEFLAAASVRSLREGVKNAWAEIVLTEGRNRQIRRLLSAHGVETLRLVRVAIGLVRLGTLAKGAVRPLDLQEVAALRAPTAEAKR